MILDLFVDERSFVDEKGEKIIYQEVSLLFVKNGEMIKSIPIKSVYKSQKDIFRFLVKMFNDERGLK